MPDDPRPPVLPPLDDDDEPAIDEDDVPWTTGDDDRSDEGTDDDRFDDPIEGLPREGDDEAAEVDDGADAIEIAPDGGDDDGAIDLGSDADLAPSDDGEDDGGALGTDDDPAAGLATLGALDEDDPEEREIVATAARAPLPSWADVAWTPTTVVPAGERLLAATFEGDRVIVATDEAIGARGLLPRVRASDDEAIVAACFADGAWAAVTDAGRVLGFDGDRAGPDDARSIERFGEVAFVLDERGRLTRIDRDHGSVVGTNVRAIARDGDGVAWLDAGGVVRREARPDAAIAADEAALLAVRGDAIAVGGPSGVAVGGVVVATTEGVTAIAFAFDALFAAIARGARTYVLRIADGAAHVIGEAPPGVTALFVRDGALFALGRGLVRFDPR